MYQENLFAENTHLPNGKFQSIKSPGKNASLTFPQADKLPPPYYAHYKVPSQPNSPYSDPNQLLVNTPQCVTQ